MEAIYFTDKINAIKAEKYYWKSLFDKTKEERDALLKQSKIDIKDINDKGRK